MKDNPAPIRLSTELTTYCKWMNSNYGIFWFIFSYNLLSQQEKKKILYVSSILQIFYVKQIECFNIQITLSVGEKFFIFKFVSAKPEILKDAEKAKFYYLIETVFKRIT